MSKILIAGGGWAGCAAAISAAKQGAEVTLVEKTDLLLGAGNVGGIMRNNGRYTATEENMAMGASELFEITDRFSVHRNVDFPGHRHASFYDPVKVEPAVRKLLHQLGVRVELMCRAVDVKWGPGKETGEKWIEGVEMVSWGVSQWMEGDGFVDASGSSGPMGNCSRYGHGCAMCVQRCPSFGPRVSLTARAGAGDLMGLRQDGTPGAFSGSCKLDKTSLSLQLQAVLERDGYAAVPLPDHLIRRGKLAEKVCQQYALDAFAENLILIDTGHVKLMSPYFALEDLRTVPGLERVRFLDPYAGGRGNSIRYMSVSRRENSMRACGFGNLFVAGEKSGFFVGHTEAITTGSLAGYNVCFTEDEGYLKLPRCLACGELVAYAQDALQEEDGLYRRFTFAGGEFLDRMKEQNLYSEDSDAIYRRVEMAGLLNIYSLPKARNL